jgi:hypothetical protein
MISLKHLFALAIAASMIPGAFPVSRARADVPAPGVESAIIVDIIAPIRSLPAADGLLHLVYELLLVNPSAVAVTIESMEVIDGEDGALMEELSGPDLGAALRHGLFGDQGTTLLPSRSALVFVDAAVPPPGPRSLKHRISTSQSLVAAEAIELGGLLVEPPQEVSPAVTFVTAAVAVDLSPVAALAPPLRGENWLIFRGCCDLATSHRGTATAYDGRLFVAERFAIDFAQADGEGRLIAGLGNELSSYASYGEPVYAVADGTVVSAHDGAPDQVPGALPTGMSAETAGGNAVIIDIGEGRFAFYAHLKPGSVSVAVGDRVTSGQQIGQLGNSGRSFAPHLHFHVMDAASPLAADGLPYVFTDFSGQGVLGADGLVRALQGQNAPLDRSNLVGAERRVHPLNGQVVGFE